MWEDGADIQVTDSYWGSLSVQGLVFNAPTVRIYATRALGVWVIMGLLVSPPRCRAATAATTAALRTFSAAARARAARRTPAVMRRSTASALQAGMRGRGTPAGTRAHRRRPLQGPPAGTGLRRGGGGGAGPAAVVAVGSRNPASLT